MPHDKLSVDERWLMRCMRGKIREKRGGDDTSAWLEEYMKVNGHFRACCLSEDRFVL